MTDQYAMQDPTEDVRGPSSGRAVLPGPGADKQMAENVPADHGEDTYRGSGRLQPAGGQPPEALPSAGEQTYLGRWGQPAELAPAYVFLASGESSYVVGETLHVDGGMPTP